jgi:ubiquinone biosynthesis protein Coq4
MNYRKQIIVRLFEISEKFYVRNFKKNKQAWGLTRAELLHYPSTTFGYQMGVFLQQNNFELIPKVERHDAYHVLTGFGTRVEDEIALQYVCFGNGKRSPYLFGVMIIGTILLPDYLRYYLRSYYHGTRANSFHHWDFKKLLHLPLDELRSAVFPRKYLRKLESQTI